MILIIREDITRWDIERALENIPYYAIRKVIIKKLEKFEYQYKEEYIVC